jgi:hypothetical protein
MLARGALNTPEVLDVREIPHGRRHPRIFGIYARLAPGESFVLVNNHDPKPLRREFQACGCRNPVTSCDLQVFVDETAEAVASEVANVRAIGWRRGSSGMWLLIEGSVRPVAVVVRGVLAQDVGEVAWAGRSQPPARLGGHGAEIGQDRVLGQRCEGTVRAQADIGDRGVVRQRDQHHLGAGHRLRRPPRLGGPGGDELPGAPR